MCRSGKASALVTRRWLGGEDPLYGMVSGNCYSESTEVLLMLYEYPSSLSSIDTL
jgi:hypothetical protein